jgi:hypothetical protein
MVKKNLAADYNGGSPAFVQSPSATVPVCGLHPSMMLELDRIHKILDSGGEEFKEIGERITALSMKVGEFIAVSNQRIETVEAYIKDYIKFSHKGQQ